MCVSLLTVLASVGAVAADIPSKISQGIEEEINSTNIYRAYYPSKELARKAGITFHNQLHEINHQDKYMILELSASDIEALESFDFKISPATSFVEERNIRLQNLQQQFSIQTDNVSIQTIPNYACYETVEETYAAADTMVLNNPNIAEFIDVGNSWEKNEGLGGFDIKVLKLTNQNTSGFKPKLFINSAIHAREYTTAPLTLAFAKWLVDGYGVDADATWILDYHEVHLLLQTNPDGRKMAETGLSWRKNTNQNYCGSTSNTRGADLNRNFTQGWNSTNGQGSSGNECSLTFRGDSPGSEPETQAIESYVRSIFPDNRGPNPTDAAPSDTSGIHIDVHSFSELVLWPWGDISTPAPNGTALQTLGRRFAYFNGYEPTQSVGLYPTDGTSDGVSYDELGVAAYTFELGTAFFQSCTYFESTVKPDNLPALIYAAKVVRAPYLLPAGPDVTGIVLSNGGKVAAGTQVSLSGSSTDTQFNNSNGTESTQNITAAEYYIDTPPWVEGATAIALSAADGSFNETTEGYSGVIDTSSLSEGQHTIFVRSMDASGRWGPVSAEFLQIGDFEEPEIDCINLENVSAFSASNSGSFSASGCTISLTGNIWRATTQTFTISPTSVLTFDFTANETGEIHGIGFDVDNTASSNRIFDLTGSQNWGITDFSYSGGTQTFSIPVGQYFTGSNMKLILVNDKDSGTTNNTTTISNVTLSN